MGIIFHEEKGAVVENLLLHLKTNAWCSVAYKRTLLQQRKISATSFPMLGSLSVSELFRINLSDYLCVYSKIKKVPMLTKKMKEQTIIIRTSTSILEWRRLEKGGFAEFSQKMSLSNSLHFTFHIPSRRGWLLIRWSLSQANFSTISDNC